MQEIGCSHKGKTLINLPNFKQVCVSYFKLLFSMIFFNLIHVQILTLKLEGLQSRKCMIFIGLSTVTVICAQTSTVLNAWDVTMNQAYPNTFPCRLLILGIGKRLGWGE